MLGDDMDLSSSQWIIIEVLWSSCVAYHHSSDECFPSKTSNFDSSDCLKDHQSPGGGGDFCRPGNLGSTLINESLKGHDNVSLLIDFSWDSDSTSQKFNNLCQNSNSSSHYISSGRDVYLLRSWLSLKQVASSMGLGFNVKNDYFPVKVGHKSALKQVQEKAFREVSQGR
jgi:hypothetical protein